MSLEISTDKTVVEARFYISGIELQPFSEYEYDSEGKPNYSKSHLEVGGKVTMSAAKHGTFGKATPFGSCIMGIQNQHAFLVFKEAFERIIKEKGRTPRFKVYFVEDSNQEPDK